MREIKFRGMSLSGEWFIGDLARPKNDISTNVKGGGSFISNSYGMPHAYAVRLETVGQYTGLKDKNGVEIYEGDLLKVNPMGSISIIEVVFDNGAFLANNPNINQKPDLADVLNLMNYEVIGNIYENPELLEKTEV